MDNANPIQSIPQTSRARNAPGHTPTELARWYWHALGWTVLPAHYPCRDRAVGVAVTVQCSCWRGAACTEIGKHPLDKWRDVEHDAGGLALWRWVDPHSNIALLTGRRSGGVVVGDVDPRHGGRLETLWEMGWSPETVIARSGGGGWHVYAVCPPDGLRSVDAYAPGIELKADGKLVIAPPSLHPTQHPTNPLLLRRYAWLPGHAPWDCAVAPLPEAVLAEVGASRAHHEHRGEPAEPIVLTEGQLHGLARKAPGIVARYVARAKAGTDGGRYNTMKHLSYQLWSLRLSGS